jgi:hypothetical protein
VGATCAERQAFRGWRPATSVLAVACGLLAEEPLQGCPRQTTLHIEVGGGTTEEKRCHALPRFLTTGR